MKLPSQKDYPKIWYFGEEIYRLKFVRKLDKDTLGECDPEAREIRIKQGLGKEETLKTLIHEIVHGLFEFEHGIKVKHKKVYLMEEAIFQFLRDNF